MFLFVVELTWILHALGSLVWDASATMIDVPLENAVNMRSVWTAWFQFWGKQHLLHIDVLFFLQYLECAAPHPEPILPKRRICKLRKLSKMISF